MQSSILRCAILMGAATMAGCHGLDESDQAIQATKNLGVYVRADGGIHNLESFGIEDRNIFTETMSFKFIDAIPKRPSVSYFVVNMPSVIITESQLFWLSDLKAAKWHYSNPRDQRDPKPIKADIEALSSSVYKVSLASPIANEHGFLCLWLKMPMGTADRMYAVEVGTPQTYGSDEQEATPADPGARPQSPSAVSPESYQAVVRSNSATFTFPIVPPQTYQWCPGGLQYTWHVIVKNAERAYVVGYFLFTPMGGAPCGQSDLNGLLREGQFSVWEKAEDGGERDVEGVSAVGSANSAGNMLTITVSGPSVIETLFSSRPKTVNMKAQLLKRLSVRQVSLVYE